MTSEELKAARGQLKLSQAELATKLGVGVKAYNAWETGRATRGVPTAASVAVLGLLGVDLTAPKPDPHISTDTHPHLFNPYKRRFTQGAYHPFRVMTGAELAPYMDTSNPIATKFRHVFARVLESPEYKAGVERECKRQAHLATLPAAPWANETWGRD